MVERLARVGYGWWIALLGLSWLLFALVMYLGNTVYTTNALLPLFHPVLNVLGLLLPGEWLSVQDPPWDFALGAALTHWAALGLLWAAYLLAAFGVGRSKSRHLPLLILGSGLLFGATTLFWRTLHSTDVYTYALYGKMQLIGLNPLAQTPAALGADPLLSKTTWPDIVSVYGPAWLLPSRLIAQVAEWAGGDLAYYALGFKLLDLGLMLLCAALVWAIAGRFGFGVGRRATATALFAWSPLLIIEFPGNAHNDLLLIFCLLLALWLHLRGWWPLAVAALICGALVKITGLVFLPAYALLLLRESRDRIEAAGRLVALVCLSAGLFLLAHAPFAHPQLLANLLNNPIAGQFGNSPGTTLRELLVRLYLATEGVFSPELWEYTLPREALTWPLFYALFAVWALLAAWLTWRVRGTQDMVRRWALIWMLYLLIGSAWLWPWYISWLAALLVFLPAGTLRRAALWLAVGSGMFYGLVPLVKFMTGHVYNYVAVLPIVLPLTLFLLALLAQRLGLPRLLTVAKDRLTLPSVGEAEG